MCCSQHNVKSPFLEILFLVENASLRHVKSLPSTSSFLQSIGRLHSWHLSGALFNETLQAPDDTSRCEWFFHDLFSAEYVFGELVRRDMGSALHAFGGAEATAVMPVSSAFLSRDTFEVLFRREGRKSPVEIFVHNHQHTHLIPSSQDFKSFRMNTTTISTLPYGPEFCKFGSLMMSAPQQFLCADMTFLNHFL